MRRRARFLAAFAALSLALGPAIAEARPGGGFSSGSRGSRSYSAPPTTRTAPETATPFNRTEAPRQSPGTAAPGYAPRPSPSYTTPSRGGMFGGGFMSGLMGGLLGAGIAGMLFGNGAFGGMSGGSGFLGFLLQLALIAGAIWLVLRVIRGRRAGMSASGMGASGMPAMAGAGPRGAAPNAYAREMDGTAGGGAAARPLQVGQADFAAFGDNLVAINRAWSAGDVAALRRLSTPEMSRYFEGDLRDLAARGWRNETSDVRLEAGDLAEAWSENGTDYATVAMRFSLLDVTRDAAGQVVEGDPAKRQTTTEIWTFARRTGGTWILSAIQQTK